MSGHDYRRWIESGYRDYGTDTWFFIRELAQNSRDAGAHAIHLYAERNIAREEVVVFQDDGRGMSYSHARRYLFRLYASSKNGEKNAAGLFGIGFWTILKFSPLQILIESCEGKDKSPWGVRVDAQLNTQPFRSGLAHQGTRITLIRKAVAATIEDFNRDISAAVERYCTFLRRNNRQADPLSVYFNGRCYTRPIKLPGPISLSFKQGGVEGAVGLDTRPRVVLYARGLPVWEGTSLEELSHSPPEREQKWNQPQEIARGLAPVFILNGNYLEVDISRKKVIDNRHLQKVKQKAEQALARMVAQAADWVSPRNLRERLIEKIKEAGTSLFKTFPRILLVLLIIIIPLEIFLIQKFLKISTPEVNPKVVSLQAEKNRYFGASVRAVSQDNSPLDLKYTPEINLWFKLFTADQYHIQTGFVQGFPGERGSSFSVLACRQQQIFVEIHSQEQGRIYLPQPPGFSIDFASVTLDILSLSPVYRTISGDVVAILPKTGTVSYRCSVSAPIHELSPSRFASLTQLPSRLYLPAEMDTLLENARYLKIQQRIDTVVSMIKQHFVYDTSSQTANRYNQFPDSADWLHKVFTIGAGDCDILNGVAALLLRKMGIPAQLAVGFIGERGRLLPGLHAWVE